MVENADKKENFAKIIDNKNCNKTQEERELIIKEDVTNTASCFDTKSDGFCVDLALNWMREYDDAVYLGCYVNKIGDIVVALYHHSTIYLLGTAYKTIMYAPRLMFHLSSKSHLHIDDVLMRHNSVGNGSIAMNALLSYAKLNDISLVTGTLSSVDDDHEVRRDGYYRKFGFNIEPDRIIKYL